MSVKAATTKGNNHGQANMASMRLAWLLAFLATLILEIAMGDGERSTLELAAIVSFEFGMVVAGTVFVRWWERRAQPSSNQRVMAIFVLATVPFLLELVIRGLTFTMLPLELLLLSHFRNVVLASAVWSHRPDGQRITCALSMFLAIFASALSTQLWLQGLVVVFAVVGVWWLIGSYWERLQGQLTATSQTPMSRSWLITLPVCLVLLLLALPVAGTQTRVLSGFLPSSGGSEWYSEAARSGVGDGDQLVAGTENIQSFAPIEDAPFLSSHEPSLYDLFDESYNEAIQPRKSDRAIALPPQQRPQTPERELAASRQADKQFSTLRKLGNPRQSEVGDRDSEAILYVKGRTPLHLKLEVFDRYDGLDWFPEDVPDHPPALTMQSLHGRPWVRWSIAQSTDIYSQPESHALKIIRLDSNRVPAPTQLLGVHIDQIDQADFYRWAQPGVLRLDRDKFPSLLTMHVQSRVVDERRVTQASTIFSGGRPNYRFYGDDAESARVQTLAEEWTAGVPAGWPQIQAIIARLRQECQLDPLARPPEDCQHTVAEFLLESRRGPDYQFASAAVQLLRSLGYSARFVSGFYVRPTRYDPRSQHTPVLKDDVHVWLEVYAGAGDWIPLEPTPGYELLTPPPTFTEQLQAVWWSCLAFIWDQLVLLSLTVFALATAIWQRHVLIDAMATLAWRWGTVREERDRVRRTLKLLLSRCRRAGVPCPPGMPPTRWLSDTCQTTDTVEQAALLDFLRLADWASYAPPSTPPVKHAPVVCADLIRVWSLRRLRGLQRTVHARTTSRSSLSHGFHGISLPLFPKKSPA
ncbi:hypothetical protein GC163_16150 [bacterium]|nr:hypothetical protein [bacterium]